MSGRGKTVRGSWIDDRLADGSLKPDPEVDEHYLATRDWDGEFQKGNRVTDTSVGILVLAGSAGRERQETE